MAGWNNITGTRGGGGSGGGGRGAGGRGFNRHYTNNSDQGGSGGGGRWGPAPPQFQYRPVDAARRQSRPLSEQQAASTTSSSSRIAQQTHPTPTADKSPASVNAAPSSTKEPDDKGSRNAANFECNVCFDMAAEPVVTKCGHLFCWECLYQWLHVHSNHRECPVCKGQVADDAIIPIYGRGGSAASVDNVPPRPSGARVESSRQQLELPSLFPSTMYMDGDEEDPFDLPGMMNFGFGATSLGNAVMRSMTTMPSSFGDVEFEDFDDYAYEYDTDDFDEVYDYDWVGFPVFAPAGAEVGNPISLQAHFDMTSSRNNAAGSTNGIYHQQEAGYPGANPHNRGRRRRNRARASADNSSTNGMVMGGSGALYRDHGASSSVSAGSSSRPSINWVERRGRSSRNSNSAGGRGGMQDSRRQRTNYN
ncbi:hypothetical protein HU200_042035 [Digitaria exilis]|uniref:E3 ubiquitin-protein ligase RMA n=1 Tax=Digitaria exilis TaxID=1010633 RepID=A0A835B7V5_9POAL|nr:hypothetical protein HU200_042035 [Digitaria exilis]